MRSIKMFYKIVLILYALYCLTTTKAALQRRFKVELNNVSCQRYTSLLKVLECDFQKIATSHFQFNIKFMLEKNIDKDIELRVRFDATPTNSKKTLNFLDVQVKLCDVLSHPLGNLVLKSIIDEIRRSSNIPQECPLQGNFLYNLNNYTLLDTTFPPYAPYMNCTLTIELYQMNKMFATYVAKSALVPK